MKCLENIDRTHIPNDIVVKYIDTYKMIGKNKFNFESIKTDYKKIVKNNIEIETFYFYKIYGNNITDHRLKILITKGVTPKNKEEQFVLNIKKTFSLIHNDQSTFDLIPNEVQALQDTLYKGILSKERIGFQKKHKRHSLLSEDVTKDMYLVLEELFRLYRDVRRQHKYENSLIIINLFIDFINMKPFKEKNDEIGVLILYILLLQSDYHVYKYFSFFETIYKNKSDFFHTLNQANYDWKEGFSQVMPMHRLILNNSLKTYQKFDEFMRDYLYDAKLNKSDNVENTINKLGEIFTKDEIRKIHPYIADATINRTLARMKEEGKIKPLGTGRSAKWLKLYSYESSSKIIEQLNFDI